MTADTAWGDDGGRVTRPTTLTHRLEYLALRTFIGVLTPLGARGAAAASGAIARLGYRLFRIRRGVVERQVAAAFPELNASAVRRIALESYDNRSEERRVGKECRL